jgi:hypothetical protein
VLQDDILDYTFSTDRSGGIYLHVWPIGMEQKQPGISVDILRTLVTGCIVDAGPMNDENTSFLKEHFARVHELFSRANIVETLSICKRLEKERGKRLFG